MNHPIQSALLGLAIGDALGVPVEFLSREEISRNPVTDMMAYGTHNQPAGTFSDDASLAFCLADALTEEFSLYTVAQNFRLWYYYGFWSARGEVFDIGIATRQAIGRLDEGVEPTLAGGFDEYSNGNGSLMRILPLLFYIKDMPIAERYRITKEVSAITHMHVRSVISCFYYLEFARKLLYGDDLVSIYKLLQTEISEFLESLKINPDELKHFSRLLKANIYELNKDEIQSSGYVIHTLEASIWCLMTTNNYKDAVLKAVNLGSDTDTTAAVTGGLSGLLYSWQNIPDEWLNVLAKKDDIIKLSNKLSNA